MQEKHALWTAAIDGRSVTAATPDKREALERWNIVMLAETFGWTVREIRETPVDVLQDIYTILSLRAAKERARSHSRP